MTKTQTLFALGRKCLVSLGVLAGVTLLSDRSLAQKNNEIGTPFIRNYTVEDFSAHSQNWNVIQDQRGVMYFANTTGILEFDGRNWNLIKTPGNSGVRSLAVAPSGTVYAGCIGDFGYLAGDAQGKTLFISLVEKLHAQDRDFNDVWRTFVDDQNVYFFARNKIFRWDQHTIETIRVDLFSNWGFAFSGKVFVVEKNRGICLIKGSTLSPLPYTAQYTQSENPSVSLLPYSDGQLLIILPDGKVVRYDLGLFFDPRTGSYDFSRDIPKSAIVSPFPTEISEFISQNHNQCFSGCRLADNQYAIPTRGGIVFMDQNGRLVRVVNRNRGLLDDLVWGIYPDRDQNLWAAMNTGIAHIEINSPISYFNTANGLDGYLNIATRFNDRVFASSFKGLFYLQDYKLDPNNDNQHFVPVKPSYPECWQFLNLGDHLVAGSNPQLLLIDNKFKVKSYRTDYVYSLGRSTRFPDIVFVGLMDGLTALKVRRFEAGEMELVPVANAFIEIKEGIRNIVCDDNGDLWLSTIFRGLIHLKFSGPHINDHEVVRYGIADGLPQLDGVSAFYLDHHLFVATPKGIYEGIYPARPGPSRGKVRFEKEKTFGRAIVELGIPVHNIMMDGEIRLWVQSTSGIGIVVKKPDGSFRWDSTPFKEIPTTDEASYVDPYGILWVPTTKGLFRYDSSVKKDYCAPFPAMICRVSVGRNNVIFSGANSDPQSRQGSLFTRFVLDQPDRAVPRLTYKNNSITFTCSAAFYEHESANRFCYLLDGFDKGWGDWTTFNTKEYTNLPERSYVFRVKARNVFDQESREAVFRFSIAPPWHRTLLAYFGFAVIGLGLLAGIVKANTFKLRREKQRLEKLVALRTHELKEASLTDPMTGLRNRRYITEILMNDVTAFVDFKKYVLEAKDRRSLPDHYRTIFGVVVFDIDHFKMINDTYGHDAGDKVLQQLAQILKSSVRADDAVMRTGGEEFMVVLKKTLPEYLETFVRKIKDKIQEYEFQLDGNEALKRTCSIGYTTFPFYEEHPELFSFEQTVMVADKGLYYAKEHGRNLAVKIGPTANMPGSAEEIKKLAASQDFALIVKYFSIKA